MRASNIALTFVAALASEAGGGFVAGLIAALLHDVTAGILVFLLAAVGSALLAGRWVARRDAPPSPAELKAGCLLYVGLCALIALGSRHPVGWGGLLAGLCIAAALHRSATRALQASAGQMRKPARARA